MSFLVIALAVLALITTAYMNLVRPARKRHMAALAVPEPEVEPQPEPRVPRDLDRPYPRPRGGRRRQDSVCPVCGTGDTTGSLDGRVLGWRAHASCAEWLGDWEPARPPPPPYKPDKALIGYIEQGQKQSVRIQVDDSPGVQVNVGDHNVQAIALISQGMISVDEARARLDGEIISSFGVPQIAVSRPAPAKPPVPTPAEYLAELEEHLHHFEEKYPD